MLNSPTPPREDGPRPDVVSLVDAPSQAVFDRLTALATRALRVPVALVSFIESERQIFRSRSVHAGPLKDVYETPVSHSLCQQVADSREPLVVPDTREDPRTRDNPAVTKLNVVAYAGMPLFDAQGRAYGAFCAIAHEPHPWTDEDQEILRALAMQVMSEVATEAVRADGPDLRTPLQAMLLGVQAIRRLGKVNEGQAECLALAERNGQVLLAMLDKLQDTGNIVDRGSGAPGRRD